MIAWVILKHAFRMIFFDFGALVRALAPGLGLFAVGMAIMIASAATFGGISAGSGAGIGLLGVFGATLIMMYSGLMIIVTWHRYVLLTNEARAAGLTPSAAPIFSYLGRTLLIGLVLLVPSFILIGALGTTLIGVEDETALSPTTTGLGLIGLIVLGWLGIRLSLILPAAAIEEPFGLMDSWQATAPLSLQCLYLVIGLSAINIGLGWVSGVFEDTAPILGTLINLIVSLFTTLLGASVLTTLYGHLVEGRDLPT